MKNLLIIIFCTIGFCLFGQNAVNRNTFTDNRDGKIYKKVIVGNQTIMAENLAYKPAKGNYWAYNNSKNNISKYGYLYDWETAKKACPKAWHLPSAKELMTLADNINSNGLNASNILFANGSKHFSAHFGGYYMTGNYFFGIDTVANFWSNTPDYSNYVRYLSVINDNSNSFVFSSHPENYGLSVRCFADGNDIIESYGAQNNGSFKDSRDGKKYKTVKIGNQIWMAENLAFKTDSGCWAYNNDTANVSIYGYLYDWYSAKGICPVGWHLPNKDEWETLTDFIGGEKLAGGKLKAINLWNSPNEGATNSTGFSAFPSGYRSYGDLIFRGLHNGGIWWSSSIKDIDYAWDCSLSYIFSKISIDCDGMDFGFSVRCLKD